MQKSVYKAKIKLELAFAKLMLPKVNDEDRIWNQQEEKAVHFQLYKKEHYLEILSEINDSEFIPEPSDGLDEACLSSSKDYYKIRSLWDFLHYICICNVSPFCYIDKDNVLLYDEHPKSILNISTINTMINFAEVYYIEDIKKWAVLHGHCIC